MPEYDVFIIYRRDGGDILSKLLYDKLARNGYRVFYDVGALRLGKFSEQILQSIAASKTVIVLLSPHSLDRCGDPDDWMRKGLEYAISQRKAIIPVMMHGFKWDHATDKLPSALKYLLTIQAISADNVDFDTCFTDIKRCIDTQIGKDGQIKKTASLSLGKPTPYRGASPYIFMSYSHKDMDEAKDIIAHLQSAGFRVWYDEGIDPGTEWDENIAKHVESCGYFITLMSNNYLESDNCKDELYFARELNKPRLLIYLEDVMLPAGMKMRLGRLQAIYKYAGIEQFYEKLYETESIKSCCNDTVLK